MFFGHLALSWPRNGLECADTSCSARKNSAAGCSAAVLGEPEADQPDLLEGEAVAEVVADRGQAFASDRAEGPLYPSEAALGRHQMGQLEALSVRCQSFEVVQHRLLRDFAPLSDLRHVESFEH